LKIYKSRDNKYMVYLPFEVIRQLGLKGDEEVDFFKFSDKAFLFAKKEDIANLLMGTKSGINAGPAIAGQATSKNVEVTQEEIEVLKKLDTLRYSNRTPANVAKILNEGEKKVLQGLINKRIVWLFMKKGSYSISKDVYDKFLMRKGRGMAPQPKRANEHEQLQQKPVPPPPKIEKNENVIKLETDGYIVLPTESEASSLSLALEDSIRSGKVLGIRAFNKKFYIVLRSFFDKNSGKVIKELKDGPKKVDELVKSTGLDEDGIRAMLYLLSEQGDVSERRKDVFTLI
jgi:bifunctional DNA-binding transcriptional regulator/antitoxin component of YhaV-PrlF toxin-antitoxin module